MKHITLIQTGLMAGLIVQFMQPVISFAQNKLIIDPNIMPAVFAPGIVSTDLDEGAISFAPDGNTVYTSQGNFATIIFSRKQNEHWTKPEVASFSGKWNDTDPFMTPDGKRLFFISDRPLKEGDQPQKVMQIWYTEQTGPNQWAPPVHLDTLINRDGVGSFAPSVSNKGTLYFCSRKKEHPGMQSYCAAWLGDNYGPATLVLISGVNSIQDPFIAPDESYLVFLSGNDLYITFRNGGGWAQAQKLGSNINNGDHNASPYVSPDGKMLYYTSARISGFYDRTKKKSVMTYDKFMKENRSVYNGSGNLFMIPLHLVKN